MRSIQPSNDQQLARRIFVNGAQAGEFTIRNAAAIWVDRLLLVGSQALRRNEEGEFGYEASGEAADRLAYGTGERGQGCQMMCCEIEALGCTKI